MDYNFSHCLMMIVAKAMIVARAMRSSHIEHACRQTRCVACGLAACIHTTTFIENRWLLPLNEKTRSQTTATTTIVDWDEKPSPSEREKKRLLYFRFVYPHGTSVFLSFFWSQLQSPVRSSSSSSTSHLLIHIRGRHWSQTRRRRSHSCSPVFSLLPTCSRQAMIMVVAVVEEVHHIYEAINNQQPTERATRNTTSVCISWPLVARQLMMNGNRQ